jgi:membrane protein
LILILSVLTAFNLSVQSELIREIHLTFGPSAAHTIESIIDQAIAHKDWVSKTNWLSGLILIISASAIFLQIQSSLNQIFETSDKPSASLMKELKGFLLKRLFSFAMVLVFVVLSVVSILGSILFHFAFEGPAHGWIEGLHRAIVFIASVLIFTALFDWLPDAKVPWRAALEGGLITAVLFAIGRSVIGWYLNRTSLASAYGAAGSMVVLLLWVYYSSVIIFFGAEIASLLSRTRAS